MLPDPAEHDAPATLTPSGAVRSFAGYQCCIEVLRVFHHLRYRIFFHAPQGYHEVVLWLVTDNAVAGRSETVPT